MSTFLFEKELAELFQVPTTQGQKHINHLEEKEKQDDIVDAMLGDKGEQEKDGSEDDAKNDKEQAAQAKVKGSEEAAKDAANNPEDEEKLKNADIQIEDVIEQINSLRSGKSLKNNEVYQNFEKYFNDLDAAEKTALFSFLHGLVQIVVGDQQGDQATEPSDSPADVAMKKKLPKEKQVFHIKPNVIKKSSTDETKPQAGSSAEDTTAPMQLPVKPQK